MNFAKLNAVKIPEGNVVSISANGNVIWTATKITWDEVLASVNVGTYATDFRIGDCVPLDLGSEGVIYMQIVAFDTDDLADGSGKAPITWIAKQLLNTEQRMNPQSVLNSGEIKEFPASISSNNNSRVEANVSTRTTFKGSIQPGEVAEITNTINPSEDGTLTITYKGMASIYGSLEVLVNGETIVADYGSVHPATHTVELVSGTAVTVIAKYTSKDTMQRDAAYVEFKSTGSFDITTTCNTVQALDYSYTEGAGAVGGWEKSEFRAYLKETIKPLIPENVRNAIKEVTKTQKAYDINGNSFIQTTIDDVWIPSKDEIGDSSCLYNSIYTDNNSRKKFLNGNANHWFLRNSSDTSKTWGVEDTGYTYAF